MTPDRPARREPGPAPGASQVTAPAKLTLELRVTGRRSDGYHPIEAEMVTVDLVDTVRIHPAPASSLRLAGPAAAADVPAGPGNLVLVALQAAGVTAAVVLVKRIPAGAGLGGGSADAAAVLRWAGVTDPGVALSIGADVPFCLVGGRARVGGIGEVVEPRPDLDQSFTLLTPPFGVSTAAVYRAWDEMGGPVGDHGNDLEPAALRVEPRLAHFRDDLWRLSGSRPRLAGSGGTWFTIGEHVPAPSVDLADGPGHGAGGRSGLRVVRTQVRP